MPWRWEQQILLRCQWISIRLHDVTQQKTPFVTSSAHFQYRTARKSDGQHIQIFCDCRSYATQLLGYSPNRGQDIFFTNSPFIIMLFFNWIWPIQFLKASFAFTVLCVALTHSTCIPALKCIILIVMPFCINTQYMYTGTQVHYFNSNAFKYYLVSDL